MATRKDDVELFRQVLQEYVGRKVKQAVEEEIVKAKKAIDEQLNSIIDNVALRIMSHYDIHQNDQRIVIEVRKFAKPDGNVSQG